MAGVISKKLSVLDLKLTNIRHHFPDESLPEFKLRRSTSIQREFSFKLGSFLILDLQGIFELRYSQAPDGLGIHGADLSRIGQIHPLVCQDARPVIGQLLKSCDE